MSRRKFLALAGASALTAACGRAGRSSAVPDELATPTEPPGRAGPSAIAFDLFTLFDPRGVDDRVRELLGETPLATTWKTRLFEYSWLRTAAGRYADFERLARDSLTYAAKAHGVTLTDAVRARLHAVFTELDPWPDTPDALRALKERGLLLAPLANFTPGMIDGLLSHAGLEKMFDARISTDRARTYKPDARAYALAEAAFGLPRHRIAFSAFGGWDAAGAHWFGFPTFWVNRLGVPSEELGAAVATGPDLVALTNWVAESSRPPIAE